jgi:serine/threonine-protein kinase
VLAVIGALAAPNLFGTGGEAGSGNSGENNAQVGGGSEEGSGGEQDGGSGEQGGGGGGSGEDQGSQGSSGEASQSATASASAETSASAQGSSAEASGDVPEPGVFTASAAESTVQAFYTMTSDGKYEDSAKLLSQDWRRSTFPNQAVFEGTFDNVKSVNFIEGPDAQVSGDAATVTGETRAVKNSVEEHNRGTWYLVREDGRWKIDGWDVIPLDSRPA